MSAPTDTLCPPHVLFVAMHEREGRAVRGRGYVRMRPDQIPRIVRLHAIEAAIGGPPDPNDGGYMTPRVVSIYYLANWRRIIPASWGREVRFITSVEDEPSWATLRGGRPRWAVCARVYPVLIDLVKRGGQV